TQKAGGRAVRRRHRRRRLRGGFLRSHPLHQLMSNEREPTELIYLPKSGWAPVLFAAGLAGLITGLFTWTPYAVIGGVVALLALRVWVKESLIGTLRLPRKQK